MTREEARDFLPYFKAFANDSKTIQYRLKGFVDEEWKDVKEIPNLSFDSYEYRFKPEPQYRQFKNKEEFWNEVKKHEPMLWIQEKERIDGTQFQITRVNNDGFYSPSSGEMSFLKAIVDYEFMDGTPFGIKEEE